MSDSFDVIMAACPAADSTLRDFDDALVELVKDKMVKSEGVIEVAALVPAGAPLGFIPSAAGG